MKLTAGFLSRSVISTLKKKFALRKLVPSMDVQR